MSEEFSTIEIELSELKEGDTLAADVGRDESMRAGTVVTKALLDHLTNLRVPNVTIQERTEESKNAPQNYADEISKRINDALSAKIKDSAHNNFQEISETSNIDIGSMDSTDKAEAANIIDFVNQAKQEILNIESKAKIDKAPLCEQLRKKADAVDSVYQGLLVGRQQAVAALEKVINEFIIETGPNRDSSILLKDIVDQEDKFLANHCMNVAIVSLAAAMELTKIMERKLNDPALAKNLKILREIKFKTFSLEELVKLGFAAFVHDIYLKKAFPNLTWRTQFNSVSDHSHIEKHASESYHLMKQFEMDYHVNKAVLQHHERIDGSGMPDGVTERMFSKYTAIIAFADRYISLTQPNPFNKPLHPTVAIKRLLTTEKKGFDTDVMVAFARAATMVPIGSWVQLENGLIGYSSIRIEGANLPLIRAVMKENGEIIGTPSNYDPSQSEQRITKLLTAAELRQINPEYLTLYIK